MPPHTYFVVPNFGALQSEFQRLRHQSGLTYDKLAEQTGVSRRTLISIENGQSHGSVETWYRISRAFGLTVSDLMKNLDRP